MKKYFIPIVAIVLIACISCKKYNQYYKPPIQPPTTTKWVVSTVAGNGTASFVNGPVASATFHFPTDVAVDKDGNIYVTDALNFCIRKIVNGGVSNVAGGGNIGIIDGIGASAQFKNPYSVAVDANGNLYTSDENDPRIRKISPAREVAVYAGIETPGFRDGNANTAQFGLVNYIVADAEGDMYISDAINNRIRKISFTGQVSTIAGGNRAGFTNGNGAAAQFSFPGGIARDGQGNLYIADRGNFCIRKITPAGDVSTFAGSGIPGDDDGNANVAQFSIDMYDIVVDGQGNLYIADDARIRKVTPQGIVSTIAGSSLGFRDGDGTSAKFNFPNGLGIDAHGNIYVADLGNNRIRKISFE